jgi:NADPH:quinone reductase-like Zn-dependent oxidoreductase
VIDAVGKLPRGVGKELLKEGGTYLNVHHAGDLSSDQMMSNLQELRKLVEREQLRAVIDRTYPIEQIVEAHRYVDKGHKKGNVVITLS